MKSSCFIGEKVESVSVKKFIMKVIRFSHGNCIKVFLKYVPIYMHDIEQRIEIFHSQSPVLQIAFFLSLITLKRLK